MKAYLDHAATTPMRPEAVSAMLPFLAEEFGNPSGTHSMARRAANALDDAREVIAKNIGCEAEEVVFTSSGTEADNLAVLGVAGARGRAVLCSSIEHHAVLHAVQSVGGRSVPVGPSGKIDLAALTDALTPETSLVSVMLANNELGVVQPLHEIRALVSKHAPDALVHTDAVAAAPWMDLHEFAAVADMMTISAHKFGGPKGIGALMVRSGISLAPMLHGGAQEAERRAGTQNVAGAVAMAAALEIAVTERDQLRERVSALRDVLVEAILRSVSDVRETVPSSAVQKLPSCAHLIFEGVDQEELLLLLDEDGVAASAGSACASGALEPSHVLVALGVSRHEAKGALRFSLGHTTTQQEIDYAVDAVVRCVSRLRG